MLLSRRLILLLEFVKSYPLKWSTFINARYPSPRQVLFGLLSRHDQCVTLFHVSHFLTTHTRISHNLSSLTTYKHLQLSPKHIPVITLARVECSMI